MGGGYLQYPDDEEQRPRFAPVSPLGPRALPDGPVPVTPPAMAQRGHQAEPPPQQLPMAGADRTMAAAVSAGGRP